jgi:phosphonate transport system substrate-binding protein
VSAFLAVLLFCFPPLALAEKDLELWVHPYVPATQVIKRFSPLAACLEEETGRTFVVRVSRDYEAHIERVGFDRADVAYLGPMSYVQIVERYGAKPILASLQVQGKPHFHGVIFVNDDSDITDLAGLSGRSFAFADPNSTMGYFLPRHLLSKAGVGMEKLSRYHHLKSHEDVALAVIGGYFDAGSVKEEVFRKYEERGLRILVRGPQMPEHLFVARSDMDPETFRLLKKVLLDIGKDDRRKTVLTSIKDTVTGLYNAGDTDYDVYREIMREVGPPVR